jgi:ADP-ribosyl-[dinitrogen reductase] hydrolase
MFSDDTEHTCMVAQALITSNLDIDKFTTDFARRLRWWFIACPAGIGFATLRACLKLWFGFSPRASGVYSAGNGPAMRSAIFGAIFDDVETMVTFVRASTRVTHSDPKAEYGAIAVALAAFCAKQNATIDGQQFVDQLAEIIGTEDDELVGLLRRVVSSVSAKELTAVYAANNGHESGVTGYVYSTVPVVIHAWLSNPQDFRAAVTSVIECGGDADTTAAIIGGIIGTASGEVGIPHDWIYGIGDWPRSVYWLRRLGCQLHESVSAQRTLQPMSLNFAAVLVRNQVFAIIVLMHGFRRMLPPY